MSRRYKARSFFSCNVCGDTARGCNFGLITCLSCKAFFRRNAFQSSMVQRCHHGNCIIEKETRINCPACRLKKCFALGMNRNLIQSDVYRMMANDTGHQLGIVHQNNLRLPMPRPLNLVLADSSNLTEEQWNFLSNIIRSYDERSIITQVKQYMNERSSLPIKLRWKTTDLIAFMNKPLDNMIPLLERSPHFLGLPINTHHAVISHNLFVSGCLNGYFIARETNQFQNEAYMIANGTRFGYDFMKKCAKDNERLETNGNLIKIMLFVLIFSSNCSMVVFDSQESLETMTNTIELFHVQNIYATLLWKYVIYLCGFNQAVTRFSLLVKTVLDMLQRIEELSDSTALRDTIDHLVAHTENALHINK